MIISLWVYFMLGDSLVVGEPPAYEQVVVPAYEHDRQPGLFEAEFRREFGLKHPHHVVCDSGWCQQKVQVMGA